MPLPRPASKPEKIKFLSLNFPNSSISTFLPYLPVYLLLDRGKQWEMINETPPLSEFLSNKYIYIYFFLSGRRILQFLFLFRTIWLLFSFLYFFSFLSTLIEFFSFFFFLLNNILGNSREERLVPTPPSRPTLIILFIETPQKFLIMVYYFCKIYHWTYYLRLERIKPTWK